jgi:3-methyladenine DNA glycosylase AlkC
MRKTKAIQQTIKKIERESMKLTTRWPNHQNKHVTTNTRQSAQLARQHKYPICSLSSKLKVG